MEMKSIKKIIKSGRGYMIFLTKEVKALDWNEKTNVLIDTDLKDKKVVLKEIK